MIIVAAFVLYAIVMTIVAVVVTHRQEHRDRPDKAHS